MLGQDSGAGCEADLKEAVGAGRGAGGGVDRVHAGELLSKVPSVQLTPQLRLEGTGQLPLCQVRPIQTLQAHHNSTVRGVCVCVFKTANV